MSQSAASAALMPAETDEYNVPVAFKMINVPDCYLWNGSDCMYGAHRLLQDDGRYWCSLSGQVSNLAFSVEAGQAHILSRFEWKGIGGAQDPAKMRLEAQVEGAWTEVSTWNAQRSAEWQRQPLPAGPRCNTWRLTLLTNHGCSYYLYLSSIRLISRLMPTSSVRPVHARMLSDRDFTDVEVVVGERRFPAHRHVLGSASRVFSAMLRSEMREAQTGEIRLEGVDERSVQTTLEYIYTGVLAEDAQVGVAFLAHTYEIAGLMEMAAPLLLQNLTIENVAQTVKMLRVYANDAVLGSFWRRLLDIVKGDSELYEAAMLTL